MGSFFSKSTGGAHGRRHGTQFMKQNEAEEFEGFENPDENFTSTKSYRNLKLVRQTPKNSELKRRFLNFDSQNLDKIPTEVIENKNLLQLYIINNNIENWNGILSCPILTTLDVSFNPLKKFPPEFLKLVNLETLFLSGCELDQLHSGLASLTKLQRFKASLNFLTVFPTYILKIPCLTELNLTGNQIQYYFADEADIPTSRPSIDNNNNNNNNEENSQKISNVESEQYLEDKVDDERFEVRCANLINLHLSQNKLPYFPTSLCLSEIRVLKIQNNNIKRLPKGIKQMKALQTLSLSFNRIEKIDHELHGMQSLKILDLAHNQISKFSKRIFEDPHFKLPIFELFLDHNQLTELHEKTFETWNQLVVVDLSKNQLHSLPSLSSAPNIQKLFITGNQISEFPDISGLKELEILAASCNKLTELPDFATNPKLRDLELTNNKLTKIQTLPEQLEEFHVSFCGLTKFPETVLAARHLRYLNISHNEIKEIPKLKGLESLTYLDVQHNIFSSLSSSVHSLIPHLQVEMPQKNAPHINLKSDTFLLGVSEMVGKRPSMEDAVLVNPKFESKGLLIGLFDGHGGSEAATYLASHTEQSYLNQLKKAIKEKDKEPQMKALAALFPRLTTEMSHALQKTLKVKEKEVRVGSTCVLVHFTSTVAYFASVGDSRAVIGLSSKKALRATVDHKPLDQDEIRRIQKAGGFVSETGRVQGQLAVSRSLGDYYLHPYVSYEPHLKSVPLDDNFVFCIVACDGLWDVMTDQEAVDFVFNMLGLKQDLNYITSLLRDRAYALGSTDNISVVLAMPKRK